MTSIVTKRLMLTKPLLETPWIERMVTWLNTKDIVRYSEQRHIKHTEEGQIKYIEHGPKEFRYIIIHNFLFIGTIAAHIDEDNSVANVGILIGEKDEWGKGYGTEAWQAFCDYLLTHGTRKIEAGAMACNFGMVNIFRKTGMEQEGTLKEHFLFEDRLVDCVQWAKFT